jgi:hypothetical protein
MKNGECINCGRPLFDQTESDGRYCDECTKEEDV